ncbi:P-loop containing nucleoside triphosphate hydrolase protein [Microdochium trichocladiopsis]|uniref:P-loop containing nucleoside triphosphate hydrolase protein n=1 Tax=Microdochium trichocladiopsis TaxID=1682393 RepID=A0A9P8YB06_9PEZI|nr:P-loop containing nucleoside triphosphate hydrolase protein [Microdochium trichocladiopsis]KAH7032813.1 P-loop containing nucleoside triphosphate hydrolase protein [Microdochium trichocladiopsis]
MATWTRASARLLPGPARPPLLSLSSTQHPTASFAQNARFSSHCVSARWLPQPRPSAILLQRTLPTFSVHTHFSSTRVVARDATRPPAANTTVKDAVPAAKSADPGTPAASTADREPASESPADNNDSVEPAKKLEFGRSEKANRAAEVNYAARLSKEGKEPKKSRWSALSDAKRLLSLVKPETKPLAGAILLLLVSSAVTMTVPWSVGKIMDLSNVPLNEANIFGLSIYEFFGAYIAILCLGAAANWGRIMLLRVIGERVVTKLRSKLYTNTLRQDAEFFDANRVGDLISRLGSDSVIVGKSITQNVSDGLRSLVSGIAGFSAMIWISPTLTMVLVYTAPFLGGASFIYAKIIRKLSREMQKNIGTMTKIAEERLGNVKTTQAFVGEQQEAARYHKQVKKVFDIGKKQGLMDARYFSTTGWMGNMTIVALLWFGGDAVRNGLMTPGDMTTFMFYTFFAGSSLFGLSQFWSELMKGVGAADRLFELQDRRTTIPPTKGLPVKSAQGIIKFENVHFAYPTRPAVKIFNGLNFEIPSGSNVCIVGPSGGGKSTVSSLLLRFYNPTSGAITINGTNITDMNAKSLRRRIGMVGQEPVLFSGTIAENISYGRPNATRWEIVQAAQKANCSFISDFPDGLETQVGPRGAQLSGGQKQRIAIARALVKDPDILILDEATSALDAESETLVNSALAELLKGRNTTISIAHRLSTIKRSDTIIVLSSDGTVAEVGRYKDLSANPDSAFSHLMEWQMSGGDVPTTPSHVVDGRVAELEDLEDEFAGERDQEHFEEEEEEEHREGENPEDDKSRK